MIKILFALLTLLLSGCLVGPNYVPPAPLLPDTFTETAGDELTFASYVCDDDFFEWWQRFNDPLLSDLLHEAARANFDLRIAFEQIYQARANFFIQAAALYPEVDLDTVAARSRNSRVLGNPLTTLGPKFQDFYFVGLDVVWQIDLFGGLERAKRAAYFNWESMEEDARAIQITVLSDVATTYVLIRALQKKVELAQTLLDLDVQELGLTSDKFHAGLARQIDVETLRSTLASDEANLHNLNSLLKEGIYSMGVLIAEPPEIVAELFRAKGPIPDASGQIPVGLPSELLRRRPDILSAERSLAAATEQIGVAVADLFPKLTLTSANLFGAGRTEGSTYGYASGTVDKLFTNASKTWGVGVDILQPVIDFGRRIEAVDVQTSIQRQALLSYEKTVIVALQEVEQGLVAYFQEELREQSLQEESASNLRITVLTKDLEQAGLVDEIKLLETKREWVISESALIDSKQALTTDLINLYKALGGEWACFYTP